MSGEGVVVQETRASWAHVDKELEQTESHDTSDRNHQGAELEALEPARARCAAPKTRPPVPRAVSATGPFVQQEWPEP
jgi:hypothetical protein